jgi:hypothetical protein
VANADPDTNIFEIVLDKAHEIIDNRAFTATA